MMIDDYFDGLTSILKPNLGIILIVLELLYNILQNGARGLR